MTEECGSTGADDVAESGRPVVSATVVLPLHCPSTQRQGYEDGIACGMLVVFWCLWIVRSMSPTRIERWVGRMFDIYAASCSETAFSVTTT